MTHLRIEQNNIQENVSSAVIEKLYQLATSGDLDQSSNLAGNLHTTATYQEYVDAIRAEYPDLTISSDKYYLYMGDPTFTQIMATRYGDGTGCVLSDCQNVRDYGQIAFGGFSGNTNITDATGLKYFTNISWDGTNANYYNGFKDCTNLQRCELPEGMVQLASGNGYNQVGFFKNCSSLTYVKLPSTITIIDQYSFGGCTSLQNIDIPSSVTNIANAAFYNSGITQIQLPENITNIGDWAFESTQLTQIYIPSSVTSIGVGFVSGCSNISSIVFSQDPGNDLTIYSGGGYLRGAFASNGEGLSSITTIDLPERLTTMNSGDQFFANLPNLTTVIFRSTTPPTCTNTNASFNVNNNVIFYVPDNAVTAYQSATVFSNYASRIKGISELPQS